MQSETELQLLRALASICHRGNDGYVKCDIVLRTALEHAGEWTTAAEHVLNGDYDADSVAFEYYEALLHLVRTPFADGKGDLNRPAAPRYTECSITSLGLKRVFEALWQRQKRCPRLLGGADRRSAPGRFLMDSFNGMRVVFLLATTRLRPPASLQTTMVRALSPQTIPRFRHHALKEEHDQHCRH